MPTREAYSAKNWQHRKQYFGETSETAFEIVAHREGIAFERFGQPAESPLKYFRLHTYMRTRPDYLCQKDQETFFLEVKGIGADGILKIKLDSLEGATYWSTIHPLHFFIYDSARKRFAKTALTTLKDKARKIPPQSFPEDGKLYYPFPASFFKWETI